MEEPSIHSSLLRSGNACMRNIRQASTRTRKKSVDSGVSACHSSKLDKLFPTDTIITLKALVKCTCSNVIRASILLWVTSSP